MPDKPKRRKHIKRENGTGSVYKRSDATYRPYVAVAPAMTDAAGNTTRTILGRYATAQEAKDALETFRRNPTDGWNMTLEQLHGIWKPLGYRKISKSLQDNYDAAWYKLRPLYNVKFRELRTHDMQRVIDYYAAEHRQIDKTGKLLTNKDGTPAMRPALSYSSLSKITILLGLMYSYALETDIVNKDYSNFVILPQKPKSKAECFTDLELARIQKSIGTVPYADCIYMMCYLSYRIGEFLTLTPFMYHQKQGIGVLVHGNKTDAGRDRLIPVHSKIKPLLDQWLAKGGQTIICRPDGTPFSENYFRQFCYYPALEQIGVRRLTPHATRRTFSTRAAAAGMREEDIIALMGHTDYTIDIDSYINQELKTLQNAIKKLP